MPAHGGVYLRQEPCEGVKQHAHRFTFEGRSVGILCVCREKYVFRKSKRVGFLVWRVEVVGGPCETNGRRVNDDEIMEASTKLPNLPLQQFLPIVCLFSFVLQ